MTRTRCSLSALLFVIAMTPSCAASIHNASPLCSEERLFVGECRTASFALARGDVSQARKEFLACSHSAHSFSQDRRENVAWFGATPRKIADTELAILDLPGAMLERATALRSTLYIVGAPRADLESPGDYALTERLDPDNTCWPCRMLLHIELGKAELELRDEGSAGLNFYHACELAIELRYYSTLWDGGACKPLERLAKKTNDPLFNALLVTHRAAARGERCQ